jgi:hypothetical protein
MAPIAGHASVFSGQVQVNHNAEPITAPIAHAIASMLMNSAERLLNKIPQLSPS